MPLAQLDGSPRCVAQREQLSAAFGEAMLAAGHEISVQRVVQLGRVRRKEFKNERQKLALEKRMEPEPDPRDVERDEAAEYETTFDRHLRHGIKLILGSEAGGIGGGVRFGSFWQAFDKSHWKLVTTPAPVQESDSDDEEEPDRKLVLKGGTKPSAAIDFLFDNLNAWALDCADAIQVARWYAMRMAMGADEFDESVSGMQFELKSHESTGLESVGTYSRVDEDDFFSPDGVLKFKRDGQAESREVKGASVDAIVLSAPVGTRVMLTVDDDDAAGTDYENENLVKIGKGLFAGHPIGIGNLARLTELLAMTVLELDEEDEDEFTDTDWQDISDMSESIYISEIEVIKKR